MKKLVLILALFTVATGVRHVLLHFSSVASAYRAYREETRARVLARGKPQGLRDVEGSLVAVHYRLESAERIGDDRVRLVVVQAVHYRKSTMAGLGNRQVAETRQHVVMARIDDEWRAVSVEREATEVRELTAEFPGE